VKEFWIYTAARFGLFIALYALVLGGYLLLNGGGPIPVLWPLLLAAVLSTLLSAYLLRGLRERFAGAIEARAGRMADPRD
jgi:hypothetical protein